MAGSRTNGSDSAKTPPVGRRSVVEQREPVTEKEFAMMTMPRPFVAAALATLLVLSTRAEAADPQATTITVPEMDCASCAKKVGGKVAEVTGVAKVEYDVKARTLKVTHKAGAASSPKSLWEAVESGGKDPSKLEAPSGTHTTKPTN